MTVEEFRKQLRSASVDYRKNRKNGVVDTIDILWTGTPIISISYAEISELQDISSILVQMEQIKAEIGKANTRQFKQMLHEAGFFRRGEETAQ